MKKISIIIPAYNVEKYIARCLDSLVHQTLRDIEVIVINDGSTDSTGAVIDSYVEQYPAIVRSFTVPNGGAAEARNYGLQQVTGEFIGFVDSDDYVQPNMFELLYRAAMEKQADIVCCDYCRVMSKKINNKSFGNARIREEDAFDRSIYDTTLLFDEVPYLWNKIFKASIIQDNHITFHKELRIYEDLVFTYTAFLYADKISNVNQVLYNYIVYRSDSLTFSFSEKRFDLFLASHMLLSAYDDCGVLDARMRDALLYVILKHIYVILERPTHWREKALKWKYCTQVFDFLEREFPGWQQNNYYVLQRKNRKKYTSRRYWRFHILLGRQVFFKSLFARGKKFIHAGFSAMHRFRSGEAYVRACQLPLQEHAVFLNSQQGKNLNGNMFYLLREMAENPDYAAFTLYVGVHPTAVESFQQLLSTYGLNERAVLVENDGPDYVKVLATAAYLFSDTSLPPYFIKREGQVYLNTWHGTPLKTLGKATANDFFDIPNVQKSFVLSDYLLYPSAYMRDIMIDDYMLKGLAHNRILMCGYPRNEIFLAGDAARIRTELGLTGKTLYAYMPTWRGQVRNVNAADQLREIVEYLREIDRQLSDDEILYVNMHPYVGDAIYFVRFKHIRKFPVGYETYDFLSTCDALITDYSSVFFDFAATRKPIILFTYDEEEYLADRGMYLDLNDLPFPKVRTVDELLAQLRGKPIDPAVYEAFVKTYCSYDAPDISRRICRYVLRGEDAGLTVEPMPESGRELVMLYAGALNCSNNTNDFIRAGRHTKLPAYDFYFSYISNNIRPNSANFKRLVNRLPYYGQLGSLTNTTKKEAAIFYALRDHKWLYPLFKKSIHRALSVERERLFTGLSFRAAILFGDIAYKKIYEFSQFPCGKILYISHASYLNCRVHPSAYRDFDLILVTDDEAYQAVTGYIGKGVKVRKIDPIITLNDFAPYIEDVAK